MTQTQIKFGTMTPGIIAVIKLILQTFNIEIPDEHINDIVNGAAALIAVIAVIMSHRKPVTATVSVPVNDPESYK